MKLQRESIKLGSEHRGKWLFYIHDDNPEALEAAEDRLRAIECNHTIGSEVVTWDKYCDGCPCYEDGFGSGFWIDVEDVEEFKAAWKKAKKNV